MTRANRSRLSHGVCSRTGQRIRYAGPHVGEWVGSGCMRIYQIEVSNLCNLACSYCPHPGQTRPRGLMSWSTFTRSIDLLQRCGQKTAYLHNFGEPLLHPDLVSFVRHCTTHGVAASFFSNGVLLTKEILAELADAGLRWLYISEHTRGEVARIHKLIDAGGYPIEIRDTFRPVRGSVHTWSGQVEPRHRGSPGAPLTSSVPCLFQRQEAAVILWDGTVNVCCIDVEGRGARGTVDDFLSRPENYRFRPIELCVGCSLMRGEEDLS